MPNCKLDSFKIVSTCSRLTKLDCFAFSVQIFEMNSIFFVNSDLSSGVRSEDKELHFLLPNDMIVAIGDQNRSNSRFQKVGLCKNGLQVCLEIKLGKILFKKFFIFSKWLDSLKKIVFSYTSGHIFHLSYVSSI